MRGMLSALMLVGLLLGGCGFSGGESAPCGAVNLPSEVHSGNANLFNPYLRQSLPNLRAGSPEALAMINQMGGTVTSIEGEAAYRPQWKAEIYPVVFGDPKAPHEILVLLDFAAPESAKLWHAVSEASRSLAPAQCKIVVFANSHEYYGTDLMGMAIWIAHNRPGQAMSYLTYALDRWNSVKAAQKKAHGKAVPFNNEYDATVQSADYPIHYSYMARLRPPVSANQELAVAKYCYNAGNVNLYQAQQISQFYGVKRLPAVVVDGSPLSSVSSGAILKALQ